MNITMFSPGACILCILMLAGCTDESAQDLHQASIHTESTQEAGSIPTAVPLRRHPDAGAIKHVPGEQVISAKYQSLLALSMEEVEWLERNGYPTAAELDALRTYDVIELSSATRNRKDPKAAALLGHRKMIDGDFDGAWAAFAVGANLGSLYARQQMAIVNAHRITGLPIDELDQADQGNLGVMLAQLEVARLLGDHRAQALIDRYGTNFDWDYYGKHVLTQTAIFMDQYGASARARGERIRGPDPRPNAEAWAALQRDPDALVKVYARSGSYP